MSPGGIIAGFTPGGSSHSMTHIVPHKADANIFSLLALPLTDPSPQVNDSPSKVTESAEVKGEMMFMDGESTEVSMLMGGQLLMPQVIPQVLVTSVDEISIPHLPSSPESALSVGSISPARGPRIKHVCRKAAVALGSPAIFPIRPQLRLSALPGPEKEKILKEDQHKRPG